VTFLTGLMAIYGFCVLFFLVLMLSEHDWL